MSTERLWIVWTDADRWHTWQDDLDEARLLGRFERRLVGEGVARSLPQQTDRLIDEARNA
jgi:hypothetical protein